MENFRPLKMLHGYAIGDAPKDDLNAKKRIIEKRINDLHTKGYGGIVTNVDMDRNYLQDEESWILFDYAINYAVEQYGMAIWLYDEKGYPSGSAGGLTLKENPDFECKALAMIKKEVNAGQKLVLKKPRGHKTGIAAYAIGQNGSITDLRSNIEKNGTLKFKADQDCSLYYFVSKKLYEGTHAQHNTCAARRYISLINKEAVQAFIKNTYKSYTDRLDRLPKDCIQAFFTDEPSFQACYINEGLNPAVVDDPIDPKIPLYPVVAWENGILQTYQERYGDDLALKLHYLFEEDGREAKIVRYHFYSMMSDLYEDAFFRQLSEFCAQHGIAFSGHLLLEENLLHHALFEGNFFNLMRHMQIPGIDMLYTKPENVMLYAETPKLLSSVAAWYGREHVMSEVSGHTENALGIPFDIQDIIAAHFVQFVLGVDIFNSYYDDGVLTIRENQMLCQNVENVCKEFAGKTSLSDVILYYPIESSYVSVKGSDRQLFDRPYDAQAVACEESWRTLIDLLLRNHYMFDCADENVLAGAEILPEECCVMNPLSGVKYHAVVVPKLSAITLSALEIFQKCADCGITVILNGLTPSVTVLGTDQIELGSSAVTRLIASENVVNANGADSAMKSLKYILPSNIELSGDGGAVIALAKKDPDSGQISYIAVNTSNEVKNITISWDLRHGAPETVFCMDPSDGNWQKLSVVSASGERISVSAEIAPSMAKIIRL